MGCPVDLRSDEAFFDDLTRRAAERRVPLDGSLELTHRCNLRCVHCYLGDQDSIRTHRREELDTREVKALLDEVAAAGSLNFTFTGGDPMVRRDFPEIYEYAVRLGLLVTVFCDGVLIGDRIMEVFDRLPPRRVEVSLYGATESTYERITQVRGSFRRCIAGIERLIAAGHRVTLKSVIMQHNHDELPAMRAMADAYGVPFYFDTALFPCLPHQDNHGLANEDRARPVSLPPVIPVVTGSPPADPRGSPTELRLNPADAAAAHLADPVRVEEMVDLYLRTRSLPPGDRLYRCSAARTTFHVDPYGALQPCTISTNGGHNVRDGGFTPGWAGPLAGILELRPRSGSSCQSCDKQALCGGCPAFFQAENGAGDVKSEYVCETTHRVFEGLRPHIEARLAAQGETR